MFRDQSGGGEMLDKKDLMTYKWKLLSKAMLDPALTHADNKCLLNILERYNKKTGIAWPSFKRLADDLDLTKRRAKSSIRRLVEYGYINKVSGTRTTSNIYTPLFDQVKDWTTGWCDKKEGGDGKDTRVVNEKTPQVVTEKTPKPLSLEPISINTHREAASVCEDSNSNFKKKKKKDSVHCQTLTDEQLKYINIKVACKSGKVDDLGAYEARLRREAKSGDLVLTDYEQLRKVAAVKAIGELGSFEAVEIYTDLIDNNPQSVTIKLKGGGQVTVDRKEAIEILKVETIAEHLYRENKNIDMARAQIAQRLDEGLTVQEIIQKVMESPDQVKKIPYCRVLERDFSTEWAKRFNVGALPVTEAGCA